MSAGAGAADEEAALSVDPRLAEAIALFNAGDWYDCHDLLEALWHETAGPLRPVLQGLLQIAVSQLHRERGNLRGAVILLGEGLGRLHNAPPQALGLDLEPLITAAMLHLSRLQALLQATPTAAAAIAAVPEPPLRLQPVRPG